MMTGLDLFKEYIVERDRKFLHYDSEMRGFVIYSYPEQRELECFLDDVFVLDSHRKLDVVLGMIRQVEDEARKRGKKYLTAAVNIQKPDVERILRSHFFNRMRIVATNGEFIYTRKEL